MSFNNSTSKKFCFKSIVLSAIYKHRLLEYMEMQHEQSFVLLLLACLSKKRMNGLCTVISEIQQHTAAVVSPTQNFWTNLFPKQISKLEDGADSCSGEEEKMLKKVRGARVVDVNFGEKKAVVRSRKREKIPQTGALASSSRYLVLDKK